MNKRICEPNGKKTQNKEFIVSILVSRLALNYEQQEFLVFEIVVIHHYYDTSTIDLELVLAECHQRFCQSDFALKTIPNAD